jgi:hypothetical protein
MSPRCMANLLGTTSPRPHFEGAPAGAGVTQPRGFLNLVTLPRSPALPPVSRPCEKSGASRRGCYLESRRSERGRGMWLRWWLRVGGGISPLRGFLWLLVEHQLGLSALVRNTAWRRARENPRTARVCTRGRELLSSHSRGSAVLAYSGATSGPDGGRDGGCGAPCDAGSGRRPLRARSLRPSRAT